MAYCSAPGIRKKHSDAQSRGGAFRGDWEVCAMLRMLRINCQCGSISVGSCGRNYKGSTPRGVTWVGRSYGDNGWRGGDQGRHPSRTARTRKDPFPTRSAYSATVMASLTLG